MVDSREAIGYDTLHNQGIAFKPLVWSCYGRPHPTAKRFLFDVANRIARRRGHRDAAGIAAQMRSDIAVEIWRRNAQQLQNCLPDPGDVDDPWPLPGDHAGATALARPHR